MLNPTAVVCKTLQACRALDRVPLSHESNSPPLRIMDQPLLESDVASEKEGIKVELPINSRRCL